ncbi:MAG: tetratricopeptide repeat protein, partial [Kiritimatiellae bacterium]|nr:tetratricopeptide repeat protein [Kiritimatiellia bacterium]
RGQIMVAVCAAAGLMCGVMAATWLSAIDALAGRTAHSACAWRVMLLVGITAGAGLALAVWRRRQAAGPALGLLFLLMGFASAAHLGLSSGVAGGWTRMLGDLTRAFPHYLLALAKTAAFFCLPHAFLAGAAAYAAMPGAVKRRPAAWGQVLTLFFLLAVAPAAFGYGIARGFLIPAVGAEGVFRLAAWWFGVLAALSIAKAGWAALAVAPLVAVVLFVSRPDQKRHLLHENVFARLVCRDSGFACGEPVFARRSRHHGFAVYDDRDYDFVFTLDGRPLIFGNRFHAGRVLSGYIPLLLCPEAGSAAYCGPQAGLYLPFAWRAGVGSVACAGADRQVVKAMLEAEQQIGSGTKAESGLKWQRARLDAKGKYDLIVLANEPAWMRGTRRAYGRSLFKKCRSASRPGGITALHVDTRLLSEKRFAAVAEDFAGVFPHVQVWSAGTRDWLLIGSGQPIRVAAGKALEVFERKAVIRDCARAEVTALPDVLAGFVCGGEGLKSWLDGAGRISHRGHAWQAPRAAFGSERSAADPDFMNGARAPDFRWLVPDGMDEDVYVALRAKSEELVRARGKAAAALALLSGGASGEGMSAVREAAAASPRDVLLTRLAETMELEGRRRIVIGEFNGALRCYENLLSFTPGTARSHYGMGYCLRARGENDAAYLHFARAVAFAPEQTGYRMELAQVAVTVGKYREADRQYREILVRDPDNAETMFLAAKTLMAKEREDKEIPAALKLAERACEITGWENSEFAYGLADMYIDAGRVMEGVGLKRLLKEGGKPAARGSGQKQGW